MLTAVALMLAAQGVSQPVRTERAACELVKARVVAVRGFPLNRIGFCDVIPRATSPRGFYVLALHSNRRCDGICSTNIGWFAVHRATGHVFEWDVAEDRLGPPISARP